MRSTRGREKGKAEVPQCYQDLCTLCLEVSICFAPDSKLMLSKYKPVFGLASAESRCPWIGYIFGLDTAVTVAYLSCQSTLGRSMGRGPMQYFQNFLKGCERMSRSRCCSRCLCLTPCASPKPMRSHTEDHFSSSQLLHSSLTC